MKTLLTTTKVLLCLAGLFLTASLDAASSSNGNFTVNAITGEDGDLTVEGALGVEGSVDFVNGIQFGSTLETPPRNSSTARAGRITP